MEKQNQQTLHDYYILKYSDKANKKYMLITPENKKIHFGAQKNNQFMDDFTITQDEQQKQRYIKRHISREQEFWSINKINLERPSFLSRFILWNKPTIYSSVEQLEHILKIKIKIELGHKSQ